MNKRIQDLALESMVKYIASEAWVFTDAELEKFAELIIEECRTVVVEVYHKTPLELCGPLLTADEEIAKYFYGVEE